MFQRQLKTWVFPGGPYIINCGNMIFRRFTIRVIILVLLISLAGMAVVWSFGRPNLAVARLTFIIIWILLIIGLIIYVTHTNRSLKTFFDSLRYIDTVRKSSGKGKSFEELDKMYQEIAGIIRQVELDRETDRQYFRYLVDHAGAGIISFGESGDVEIINNAAKKILKIRQVKNISALSSLSAELPHILSTLKPGQQKLLKLNIDSEVVGLSVRLAEYRISGRKIRLVSLQNIRNELEEEELDAWQKLIRVLTHEIMNSITPVNSLTNTIIRMLESEGRPKRQDEIDEGTLANVLEGLHSIEKRNKGLIGFVQSYRSLTRIQKPVFTKVDIEAMFKNIGLLVKEELEAAHIHLFVMVNPAGLTLDADEKLLEQVIINLINNSRHALMNTENPEIVISAKTENDQVLIEVKDNGTGIPEDVIGNIFIPFFTTRAEGSGIGLSLSRQIMRLHGGNISVKSRPGVETIFTLKLPL
jgi:two-component system, NtrC family, nitrogen regulation sensor histidine kinase NtrY